MKTIGLIGGLTWQSSKFYYEYLNTLVAQRLGGSHSAKILMSSVDFAAIEKLSFENDWDSIGKRMALEAKRLETAGADVLLVGSNTIHLVSDYITKAVKVPYLHIAHATGGAIVKKGIKKVGLLGTKFTMEKEFYTKVLMQEYGLDVVVPNQDDRNTLNSIIYGELAKGNFTEAAKAKCLAIINKMVANGAQGIVLGCTELPILIPPNEVGVAAFDTTWIHSQKAVDLALGAA